MLRRFLVCLRVGARGVGLLSVLSPAVAYCLPYPCVETISEVRLHPRGQVDQSLQLVASGELYRARTAPASWEADSWLLLYEAQAGDSSSRGRQNYQAFAAAAIIVDKVNMPDSVAIAGTGSKGIEQLSKQAKAQGWSFERRARDDRVTWRLNRRFASLQNFRKEDASRLARVVQGEGTTFWDRTAPVYGDIRLVVRNFVFVRWCMWEEALPSVPTAKWGRKSPEMRDRCGWCGGTGRGRCPECWGSGRFQGHRCYVCAGKGKVRCILCDGSGKPSEEQVDEQVEKEESERSLAGEMFPVRYRVTMPGVITSTNAYSTQGSTAEWRYPSLFDFERGQTLRVASRYVDWYALGGVVIGIVGVSAGWLSHRRRRPKPPPLVT